MKVIFLKDFEKIGKEGEIREIKDGYGRNFLIPKGIACYASPSNIKKFEEKNRLRQLKSEKLLKEMQSLQNRLNKISITIEAKTGEEGKLFGAIVSEDIILNLKQQHNIEIDKHQVTLDEPIKQTGVYKVPVHLMEGINAEVKIWIVEAKK
ncbi:MAG: 50S ribosomal protein L9 [Candidatus Omnitrophica bacterium]|nr:50S ribosomal protein L9 [Candidatus Omnitrophota bacterium]